MRVTRTLLVQQHDVAHLSAAEDYTNTCRSSISAAAAANSSVECCLHLQQWLAVCLREHALHWLAVSWVQAL
jgi:hypothetical protein